MPETGSEELDMSLLLDQAFVDRARLEANIDSCLADSAQVSLAAVLSRFPLEEGLSELVAYVQIASERPLSIIDETGRERVSWVDDNEVLREARSPLILFCRSSK
ncbi:DUF3375 family protein [Treponema zuelzerae]|uniref:DUF3375 family protein n=2 Tax=Teretinema zuelzerae TaxID=156 RepID=A0AAE3EH21_9SPIR|nr:DUF3375 family protein [Teretinema zuelzerae]